MLLAGLTPLVAARAAIRELPVPVVTIQAADVITAGDIVLRKFQTTERSVRGIALRVEDIVGLAARRRLVAGRPVPLSALRKMVSVERGRPVTAILDGDGLSITASLVAMEDGSAGDEIAARNPQSGAIVRAMVLSDGTLRVSGP